MPRIRQYAQKYAEEDFWREIQSRKALTGIRTDKELADFMGLCASGLSKRKQNMALLTVPELRQMVALLRPDPVTVLKLLGYAGKDIPQNLNTEVIK